MVVFERLLTFTLTHAAPNINCLNESNPEFSGEGDSASRKNKINKFETIWFFLKVKLLAGGKVLGKGVYPVKVTVMEGDLPISTNDCGGYADHD